MSVAPSTGLASLPTNTSIAVTDATNQFQASATSNSATLVSTQVPVSATHIPTTFVSNEQATSSAGLVTSYGPLTLVVPLGLANGVSGIEMPRIDREDAAWWQKTPGHWQINLGEYYVLQGKSLQPQIYVYPAMAYAELVPNAFESIHRLDNILYSPGGSSLSSEKLPIVPFFNAKQVFTSNAQVISFQNGAGVRFLTEYAQYPASVNNQDLFYHFQGVTRDGTYYIVAILPITAPGVGESNDPAAALPIRGIEFPKMGDPNANWNNYYAGAAEMLNATPSETFMPTLNQLDALIQSIQITP